MPEVCPILGIKLTMNKGRHKSNSYSLDRVDNSKGYILGNIQVISFEANTLKSKYDIKTFEKIVEYINSNTLPTIPNLNLQLEMNFCEDQDY